MRMLSVQRHSDATVVELSHDLWTFDPFFEEVYERLLQVARTSARLIIDLGRAKYIQAGLLGALLNVTRGSGARPGDLVLCELNGLCREILHVTRLDTIWPIYTTREEALATPSDGDGPVLVDRCSRNPPPDLTSLPRG
jgi:anti-anti-sigma factor